MSGKVVNEEINLKQYNFNLTHGTPVMTGLMRSNYQKLNAQQLLYLFAFYWPSFSSFLFFLPI